MIPIHTDFRDASEFDQHITAKLAEFFDVDYTSRNLDQYRQWFHNLSALAMQNLGLAHCVLHNQTARNLISVCAGYLDHADFDRPYHDHVGAYGIYNSVADSIILDGDRLKGRKCWASQLHQADFCVLRVLDTHNYKRFVFLDLRQINCDIVTNNFDSLGMRIARASDLEIDVQIPGHWILDSIAPNQELLQVTNNYHKYGLITNYWSLSRALLNQARYLCEKNQCVADFEIQKLELQADMLQILWDKNMCSLLESFSKQFWHTRDTQYNFGKKTLIDIINFFLQIANSRLSDIHSLESQIFRDSIVFASHIENLYKNIHTNITNRNNWQS